MTVNTALTVQDATELSQTPLSFNVGVSRNSAPMGNTNVPKNEVSKERPGRSNAVK